MAERGTDHLHYIDWLRVIAVLLLFPFHTLRVYNAGDPFYVKGAGALAASFVIGFIDRWHMPLLFFLAGAATYYALQKRSVWRYLRERSARLLIPLVFGIFALIPPQTWYGAQFNSEYTHSYWYYLTSGDFLVWNIQDGGDYYGGFGIGHLWFILWLFFVSLLALPLLAWARSKSGTPRFARFSRIIAHPAGWLLAAFIILLGDAMPDPIGKNPFYFLAFFVLGYAAMCDPAFVSACERWRWPALSGGAVLTLVWMFTGDLRDSMPDPSPQLAGVVMVGMLAAWLMIVGAMGLGRHHLDRPSASLSYLSQASYPVYVVHQTAIVIIAFYLVRSALPWPAEWAVLLSTSVAVSFAVYEGVRRIPLVRVLFGMRAGSGPGKPKE